METDSITAPDAEEAAMRDMGQAADAEQGREPVEAAETPKPQAPEAQEEVPEPEVLETGDVNQPKPPSTDEPLTSEPRPRDPVTGKFQKPETDYTRAQKEQERKDRSWQRLQVEKDQVRAERAQWEEQRRMQELEATRRAYQPLKKEGLTASEYYEGAQRFERDGDHENALKAYKVASEMGRAEQERYTQFQEVEAEYQWRTQMQQAIQAEPKIGDPDSPISQHLARIIRDNDWLYRVPNGFLRAAEVAHMLTEQGSMKEKDDRIEYLEAQLEKYQRKGQPAKGGYAAPRTGEKDFDQMDLDEMEAHLKGITSEADHWR